MALFSIGSIASVLLIRPNDIDDRLARGAKMSETEQDEGRTANLLSVLTRKPLLIFALAVVLFHFANAAMLPLVGQYMTVGSDRGASLSMSACIIVAQLVMVPVAKFAGHYAEAWGRKPVFLIGFAVLPIRGLLYIVSDNPYWLVSVQALDGIGAGIFGVVWVIMVADLTRGSGRYNVTLGAIATAHSIGAALSNLVTGFVVDATGYIGGFVFLAAVAVIALGAFWLGVSETRSAPAPKSHPIAAAVAE